MNLPSYTLLLYENSEILDTDDINEIREMYKNLIRKYHAVDQIGYLHEWFISLTKEQLSKLRLSIQPRTEHYHENVAVHIGTVRDFPHVLLVKRSDCDPVYWSSVSHE